MHKNLSQKVGITVINASVVHFFSLTLCFLLIISKTGELFTPSYCTTVKKSKGYKRILQV